MSDKVIRFTVKGKEGTIHVRKMAENSVVVLTDAGDVIATYSISSDSAVLATAKIFYWVNGTEFGEREQAQEILDNLRNMGME